MDRFDAVEAAEFVGAEHGHPLPLRHVPADRDRRPGVQVRRRVGDLVGGRDPRAGRDPLAVTHAIVLIEAERDAMSTLGGVLADIEGVARGLLGDGRVGLRRDRARPRATRSSPSVVTGALGQLDGHRAHADDGRLRGLLQARPRGAVLDRLVKRAAALLGAVGALAAPATARTPPRPTSAASTASSASARARPSTRSTSPPTRRRAGAGDVHQPARDVLGRQPRRADFTAADLDRYYKNSGFGQLPGGQASSISARGRA